jgi:hypothetical protein
MYRVALMLMDNFYRLIIGDGQQQYFLGASLYIHYTFSSRAQFSRRDTVYYQSMPVKAQDTFVITCTITSSPSKPSSSLQPRQPVPKSLLDTVGSLLDDPLYSDVCFTIPGRDQSLQSRKIWASKRLLQRAEYFRISRAAFFFHMNIFDTICP